MSKLARRGFEYYYIDPWYIRPFVKLSSRIQMRLYKNNIYWHNIISGECTPGFECCNPDLIPDDVKRDRKLKKLGI